MEVSARTIDQQRIDLRDSHHSSLIDGLDVRPKLFISSLEQVALIIECKAADSTHEGE